MKCFQIPHNLKAGILVSTAIMLLAFCYGAVLEAFLFDKFQMDGGSITFYDFFSQDTYWCLFAATIIVVCIFLQNLIQLPVVDKIKNILQSTSLPWLLAVITGVFMCFGAIYLHGYTYSLDEYMVEWQAVISLNGDLVAHLPEEFQSYKKALQPYFIFHFGDTDASTSGYRPVFGWIWAAFDLLNIGILTNAILSTACIPLIHQIAKNIWPDKPWLWGLAAVLLATSPHFVFPAMTSFVWPAVLFFNLLWLFFFIQQNKRCQFLAMVVGFLAVGLHQIHAHLLFAAPFVLWALFSKQYRLFIHSCITYLLALLVWMHWHEFIRVVVLGVSIDDVGFFLKSVYLRGYFAWTNAPVGAYQFEAPLGSAYVFTNVMRFLAWLGLPLLVLFIASLFMRHKKPILVTLCLCSVLLTFFIHSYLMPDSMHGWGYRYMQGTIGGIVVLAIFAFDRCVFENEFHSDKSVKVLSYLSCLLIASLMVSFPMRLIQMREYIQPKMTAYTFLTQQDVDIVLLDVDRIFFGSDMVRNDPYLRNRPLIMELPLLSEKERETICGHYKTTVITYEDIARFGILHTDPPAVLASKLEPRKRIDLQKDKKWGCTLGSASN